jgi:DNA-binding beta-propeller fold protein YncE
LIYATGCNFFTGEGSKVVVIDGRNNQIVKNIQLNDFCSLGIQGIAANPLTNRIYISDYDENQEVVVDGSSNEILTRIDLLGREPVGVAVDLVTNNVWVGLDGPDGKVDIIDGATNILSNTITLGDVFVTEVAINPFTHRAYISTPTPSGLFVVNTQTQEVVTSVSFGSFANAVDVDPVTNLIFVTDGQGNQVWLVDGRNNTVRTSVPVTGPFPVGVGVNPVTHLVYVAEFDSTQVEILTEK